MSRKIQGQVALFHEFGFIFQLFAPSLSVVNLKTGGGHLKSVVGGVIILGSSMACVMDLRIVRSIDLKKEFGATVRDRRTQLGLSQEKLAERADLHRTYISDIERGARNVSLESIEKLASALEVSVAALFPKSEFQN